jgi:hypothetical protein
MVRRWWAHVGIGLVVALAGAGAGMLAGGLAGAQASDTSSAPVLSRAGLSLPGLGITLPSIGVTVPSVGVTLPGVTVSTPAVTVSTPEVGVSTPQVEISTPTQTSTTSTETPTTSGGGTTTSRTGGGAGTSTTTATTTSSPATGGHSGDLASVASVSGSAPNASHVVAPGQGRSAGGASGRIRAAARAGRRGHRGAGAVTGIAPATAGASALTPKSLSGAARGTRATRATAGSSGNPLEAIGKRIPLPLPVPDWSKPIILALLALAIWFGVRSRMAGRRAGRLERQRTTLQRDVGAMQAALVPEIPARVGGLAMSVAYRPAEGPAAGGDFYDVFVPEQGKVAIVLGDVAGHGPRALTRAALTRYTLRAYLQAGLEPRAALALAGRVLADPTAEQYATVAVAVYRTRDGVLTYASAGHPPPIVHGVQAREPLAVCASPPVGWTVPTGRRQTSVSLDPGAVVCFFSDGLIEARYEEGMLGRERLGELLAGMGSRPDAAELLELVRAETVATPDDMAACVFVPELTVIAGHTHVEEFEADARALSGTQVRDFLEGCLVSSAEIERAIDHTSGIAAACGAALLRVELGETTSTVSVSAPASVPRGTMPDRWPEPTGEPSGVR